MSETNWTISWNTSAISNTIIPTFISPKRNILVIGAGGIGSNLAFLLAQNKNYNVTLIDDDIVDDKFYNRFIFKLNNTLGISKVDAVKSTVEHFGKSITIFNKKFEDVYNKHSDEITNKYYKFIFITVDNIESRKRIENIFSIQNRYNSDSYFFEFLPRLIHVGCNLNSVSIYKTASNLIGDDTPLIEGTSYDTVPDIKTYLQACISAIEEIDHRIDIFNEFLPTQLTNIPIKDAMEGWSIIEYQGTNLIGKRVQIKLKGLYKNDILYKIKENCTLNIIFNAFLAYNSESKYFYLFNPDGTHLTNPHTMNGSYLCTGDIDIPKNPSYSQIKNIIERIADSLEIPNLDSALRTNFGSIDLNTEFINEYCIKEINMHYESNVQYQYSSNSEYEPIMGIIDSFEIEMLIPEQNIPAEGGYIYYPNDNYIVRPSLIYCNSDGELIISDSDFTEVESICLSDPDEPP